jgi:hypothetical protein
MNEGTICDFRTIASPNGRERSRSADKAARTPITRRLPSTPPGTSPQKLVQSLPPIGPADAAAGTLLILPLENTAELAVVRHGTVLRSTASSRSGAGWPADGEVSCRIIPAGARDCFPLRPQQIHRLKAFAQNALHRGIGRMRPGSRGWHAPCNPGCLLHEQALARTCSMAHRNAFADRICERVLFLLDPPGSAAARFAGDMGACSRGDVVRLQAGRAACGPLPLRSGIAAL